MNPQRKIVTEEAKKVLKAVTHYQKTLVENKETGDTKKLLHAIDMLSRLPIGLWHLEESHVGRTVNELKKTGGVVGRNARHLVDKWRTIVEKETAAEEEDEEEQEDVDDGQEEETYKRESDDEKISYKELDNEVEDDDESQLQIYERENSVSSSSGSEPEENPRNDINKSNFSSHKSSSSKNSNHYHNKINELKEIKTENSYKHISSSRNNYNITNELSSSYNDECKRNKDNYVTDYNADCSDINSSDNESVNDDINNHRSKYRNDYSPRKGKKRSHSSSSDDSDYKSKESHRKSKKHSHNNLDDSRKSGSYASQSTSKHHKPNNTHKSEQIKDDKHQLKRDIIEEQHKNEVNRNDNHNSDKKHHKHHHKNDSDNVKMEKLKHHISKESNHKMTYNNKQDSKKLDKSNSSKTKDSHHRDDNNEQNKKRTNESKDRRSNDKNSFLEKSRKNHHKTDDDKTDSKQTKTSDRKSSHSSKRPAEEIEAVGERKQQKHDSKRIKDNLSERDSKRRKDKHTSSDKMVRKEKNKQSRSASPTDLDLNELKSTSVKSKNGIDSESGTSFAAVLGMLEPFNKNKKKTTNSSNLSYEKEKYSRKADIEASSRSTKSSTTNDRYETNTEKYVPEALSKDVKLEPLSLNISNLLPPITTNYKPLPFPLDTPNRRVGSDSQSNDLNEAFRQVTSSKHLRTKVFSGSKTNFSTVTPLSELCIRILQDNIDALEYTGGVPYLILKPILEKANPQQLYQLEFYNPYLMEDTADLWKLHCQKEFRNKKRDELESWREMYVRCLDEREAKLKALTANIKQAQDKSLPVRTTKLAYVDSIVKPPRNVLKKQAKNNTASDGRKPFLTPTDRLNQLAKAGDAGKVSVPNPGRSAVEKSSTNYNYSSNLKPKKAPLMAKTLSLLRSTFARR